MNEVREGFAVTIEALCKVYRTRELVQALDGVDLEVLDGEMLVLLGPSGCGKTTLLRSIAGLETPSSGTIALDGQTVFDLTSKVDVRPNRRDVSLVFQNFALWPHMTVEKNLLFPLKARHLGDRERRVREALDTVQCVDLASRYPSQLSGGQQQRIALARALVSEPSVLLFDEPLSNLDALLRADLRRELHALHSRLRFTGIYVTHDQAEAMELGDRIAVMRDGVIVQLARPEVLHKRPASPYVANFLGIANRLRVSTRGHVSGIDATQIAGAAFRALKYGEDDELELFFRQEDVQLVSEPDRDARVGDSRCLVFRSALVSDRLYKGSTYEYVMQVGDTQLLATEAVTGSPHEVGDRADLVVSEDALLLYVNGRLATLAREAQVQGSDPAATAGAS